MILTTQCFNKKVKKNMHVMAKPIGAKCNLDCQYCYYLSKEELLADRLGACEQMNEESLEAYIKQYFAAHNAPQVNFSWQGGEPTMLGLDYFRTVVRLQKKYCPKDVEVLNDLQTNGTLLNDEWCQFLAKHQFLVGISIDGDEMLHNTYRTNRAGRGTWQQVMGAIELLKKHEVSFCTLTCVNRLTSQSSLEVYRFLRDVVQSPLIQFIPIVEPKTFRTQSP
ncbi:anaerobic sulfatase-maturating enzyme [Vibrio crassostreae]|nr:anaerobic sulfatase-maturating enzyme [Vibrio crassostreae]